MKRLLLVSTISLFSTSVYAVKTTKTPITKAPITKKQQTQSPHLITLENAFEIHERNNNITIKTIQTNEKKRSIKAILVTPCITKQQKSIPTIIITLASPDKNQQK
jgi:hypothetical protein